MKFSNGRDVKDVENVEDVEDVEDVANLMRANPLKYWEA